ncbi:hypothetical protein GCM10010441_20440 [Kitasatospora paracochleata]|uniref:Endonuclease/exonuclease/phosphatase family metal-dependent hydrolase n=1 Tax=Kitasatospora paracochleata TaxID=58354 RepID=A0ABT1J845_9ACTN|nr:endonuclease/exonuclease/phosphatase family protein [Kitasatospora paracochleata]MCP2313578.1 endonuclease/exonuclease/phosphatase family metal-dependent hydrolase [Kitasatospora paracochleata]
MAVVNPPRTALSVASWNLHEGLDAEADPHPGAADSNSMHSVAHLVREHGIDVIGLQEVGFDADGTSELLDFLQAATPLRHIARHPLHESSFFPGRLSGVAIASRFPLYALKRHSLPNPRLSVQLGDAEIRSHDKGFMSAQFDIGEIRIGVTVVHALPFHLFRREAADAEFKPIWEYLSTRIGEEDAKHAIICGDFNTPDRGLLLRDGFLKLSSAMGKQPTYKDVALDDILYGFGLRVGSATTVDNFSDHKLCIAEVLVPSDS